MRWLIALLLMSFPAFAETVTTSNVLPEISEFQTSGSTDSLGGTGDAKSGGGTYTSSGDIPLTKDQVNRGFDINSSFTVKSHSSNAVLASCTSITQTSDCRDIASLTMSLYDSNALVKQFKHEVELDFSGLRSYSFTDIVAANTYGVLTGSYALYGIDAGWHHGGMYGPVFIDPSVTFTYQNIIEQQIIDQIAQNDLIVIAPPVEIIVAPPVSSSPPPAAAPVVVAAAPEAPPPPPEIAPIQLDLPPPPAEQQQQEAQAEATIEAQIEQAPEPAEASSSSEETTEAAPEAAPESAPAVAPTRQQKIKAAAQKVVAKIAPSQRYSAAAQTTMLVAMGMIAPRIKTGNALVDVVTMPTKSMSDDRSLANPMRNYTLFGRSNGAHNALVELDWRR